MISILSGNGDEETISDLLNRVSERFIDTSEFIHALDILYVLDLINIDPFGNIKYAS
ncbi:TPA: ABC-three component system middle component 7 [Providencia rettgeri]